jgi:hypothetical protein
VIDFFVDNPILCSAVSRVFADGLDTADTLLKRFLPRLGPRGIRAAPSFAGAAGPAAPIDQSLATVSTASSARCISTVSTGPPNFLPMPRRMPALWKPQTSCKRIEPALSDPPMTATI